MGRAGDRYEPRRSRVRKAEPVPSPILGWGSSVQVVQRWQGCSWPDDSVCSVRRHQGLGQLGVPAACQHGVRCRRGGAWMPRQHAAVSQKLEPFWSMPGRAWFRLTRSAGAAAGALYGKPAGGSERAGIAHSRRLIRSRRLGWRREASSSNGGDGGRSASDLPHC